MAFLDATGLSRLVSNIFNKTFTGASSSAAGSTGVVPAPSAGDEGKYLKGDGTWGTVSSGGDVSGKMNTDGSNAASGVTFAGAFTVGSRGAGSTVGTNSFGAGTCVVASGNQSHAEGYLTTASGNRAHAEGNGTCSSERASHSEGFVDTGYTYYGVIHSSGAGAHAEGYAQGTNDETQTPSSVLSSGTGSHAEGYGMVGFPIVASGQGSHAEGVGTCSSGQGSHSEGLKTSATGPHSHAEGSLSSATYDQAHAEGDGTLASGYCSHSEGFRTTAAGESTHTSGTGTCAGYNSQTTIGRYNSNKSTTLFEVGAGTSAARSNAFEVYSDGSISMDNGTSKIKVVTATNTSVTLSTSNDTTVTFNNAAITADSAIDVYTDQNMNYKNLLIDGTNHTVTITYGQVSSSVTMSVKIYIK